MTPPADSREKRQSMSDIEYDTFDRAADRKRPPTFAPRSEAALAPPRGDVLPTKGDQMSVELQVHDLSAEQYREYEWVDGGSVRTYRIDSPKELHVRAGATTHRVVDAEGIVHGVPAVGRFGCVLRWKPRDAGHPVQF